MPPREAGWKHTEAHEETAADNEMMWSVKFEQEGNSGLEECS
jgi:hypothetical protein